MSVLKLSFVALCSFGFGVALMDTLQPKKTCGGLPPYAEALRLTPPIQCDAVVNGKCYIRGLRK